MIRQSLCSFLTLRAHFVRPKCCAALRALRFAFCRTSFGSNSSGIVGLVVLIDWISIDFLFFFKLVRPEGFEPPTLWFVARYSIQLSYGRIFYTFIGGEGGIRTLDGLLTHTPLAGERLRPLGHLSIQWSRIISVIMRPSTSNLLILAKFLKMILFCNSKKDILLISLVLQKNQRCGCDGKFQEKQ